MSSIRFRASASIVLNAIRAIVGFTTAMLLARWMEPEQYGRLAFLLASLLAFKQLIDMSTSQAFFTFLSQRPRGSQFLSMFFGWVIFQLLCSVIIVSLIIPDTLFRTIWQGESRSLVILALIATFMQHHVWQLVVSMADASRQTVRIQVLSLAIACLHLVAMASLWAWGKIGISFILVALIIEWSIACMLALKLYISAPRESEEKDSLISVVSEFWIYCKPLILYSFLAFGYNFLDRWMLQFWGGSSQQAFYAVGAQLASVCLIATAAVTNIFWKEIAESFHRNELTRVHYLYTKASKILFVINAAAMGTLIPWADEILFLVLGKAYSAGSSAFLVMLLYPIYQSSNTLATTVLYATEHSRQHANIGYIFMILSMVATYFLLAPSDYSVPGFGLKSEGLALKMVIMVFIQAHICMLVISRLLKLKIDYLHQFKVLTLVLGISFICKYFVSNFLLAGLVVKILVSSAFFILFFVISLYYFPNLVDLTRLQIRTLSIKNLWATSK